MPVFRAQEGKQEMFLASKADICLYGGAAGGGKTFALLLEFLRHYKTPYFGGTIFRQEMKQITQQGALVDTAMTIYPHLGSTFNKATNTFKWESVPSAMNFSYITRDSELLRWQGTQICYMGFDELTHFSKKIFFYMLSRNRSVCGVKPYIRATTNPDPDSWVRDFINYWIGDNGYAIEDRAGDVRWFINYEDEVLWYPSKEKALIAHPTKIPKSFQFIPSNVNDNKILLENDPNYKANLENLNNIDRERLLKGNWNLRMNSGDYFNREKFLVVAEDELPKMTRCVRSWDFAVTKPNELNDNPDWTVGCKIALGKDDIYYVLDVVRFRDNPVEVENTFLNIRSQDTLGVDILIPQDPGAAGVMMAENFIKKATGSRITAEREGGSKEVRAAPASAQVGIGNVRVLRGDWNDKFFSELDNFPSPNGKDDQVDAFSNGISYLIRKGRRRGLIGRKLIGMI